MNSEGRIASRYPYSIPARSISSMLNTLLCYTIGLPASEFLGSQLPKTFLHLFLRVQIFLVLILPVHPNEVPIRITRKDGFAFDYQPGWNKGIFNRRFIIDWIVSPAGKRSGFVTVYSFLGNDPSISLRKPTRHGIDLSILWENGTLIWSMSDAESLKKLYIQCAPQQKASGRRLAFAPFFEICLEIQNNNQPY